MISILTIILFLPQNQPTTVDQLGWMAGCWVGERKGRITDEQWMKPAGGTMMGMSRTVAAGRTIEYEFLQIIQDTTGNVYYVARPSGQEQATFRLVKSGRRELVFENLTHDFPQRIVYRLQGTDSLIARIEGTIQGREKRVDYPMRKSKYN